MRKFLAAIAAAALLLAACGGDDGGSGGGGGGSPEETLRQAVENLSEGGHTFTLSLSSDAEQLAALSEGELNEETASKILDSSLSFSFNDADDPAEAEVAIAANIAGSTDVELRVVDEVLYLRVDVDSLLDLAGPEAKAQAGPQIQAFVQQAQAQGLDWVEPGVNGEWLAFTGFAQLLEQFGGGLAASPSAEQQAIVDQFAAALTDDATVTSEGDEDAGEHLVASIEYKALIDNFKELAEGLGQAVPTTDLPADSEIPEGEMTVDFWVSDGELTQVELDFVQLAVASGEEVPEGLDTFGLRVAIEGFDGGVEVPSDANEVDLTQLIQSFAGGLGGSTGGTGAGGGATGMDAFCEQLKSQPKSVQKQFAADCPDL
ncbi:MAG TPA: hypothetical protein VIG64_07300 [Actinomycetota bacterium]|jgi:hypothetical protein